MGAYLRLYLKNRRKLRHVSQKRKKKRTHKNQFTQELYFMAFTWRKSIYLNFLI